MLEEHLNRIWKAYIYVYIHKYMFVCIYKRNLLPHVSVCMRMHKIHSKFFHVNNLPSKVHENLMKAHPMDNSHCS